MAITEPASLVETIRSARLLDESQLVELEQLARSAGGGLADELVRRSWLTSWQLDRIEHGEARKLTLGNYILVDLLGKGGMGEVYKARQRRLKRLVALKVIHPNLLADADMVQRFHREAEAAARLDHPNIVRIHDAADADGVHFLAMEYVDGVDLAKLLKRSGPLPVGQACDCARQAALGLQHAHEQGLVHRDVKPGNLMLVASSGAIKVLDLGLAKVGRGAVDVESALTLTQAGTPLGTPVYWAPEQAMNAHGADIRADIYSLGCTLYHLLAGRPPFLARELPQLIAMHLTAEPDPVEKARTDLPAGLADVVRKMMTKKPEDRYQTPGEAAKALEPWAKAGAGNPAAVRSASGDTTGSMQDSVKQSATVAEDWRGKKPPAHGRRVPLLVAVLVLLAVGAGGVALLAPERFAEAKRWLQGLVGGKGDESGQAAGPPQDEKVAPKSKGAAPVTGAAGPPRVNKTTGAPRMEVKPPPPANLPAPNPAPKTAADFLERGNAALERQDLDQALKDLDEAIRLDPRSALAFNARGNVYYAKLVIEEAIKDYTEAIRLDPKLAVAFYNRGNALQDFDASIADYTEAIRLDPKMVDAFIARGNAYHSIKEDFDEAIRDYTEAIRLDPNQAVAFLNRGNSWSGKNDLDRAIKDYNEAVRLDPKFALAFNTRGQVWEMKGDLGQAVKDYGEAVRLEPKDAGYANTLAWLLATCPDDKHRDGKRAVELARAACELTEWNDPELKDTLAAAYAEAGNFTEAVKWQKEALKDGPFEAMHGEEARARLALYEKDKPYRQPPPAPPA